MDSPYLSIVIVGRNDNHGVNFVDRLNTFIRGLDFQVTDRNLLELVIVEWNPLEDKSRLFEVIAKPTNCVTRIVTVPREIHDLGGHRGSFAEYHAKNVGIRRARGQYVLVTNPDVIFSRALIDWFHQRQLREDVFYRCDRYDFEGSGIELLEPKDFEAFAIDKTFQVHLSDNQVHAIEVRDGQKIFLVSDGKHIHTNASGDFILASPAVFSKIGGMFAHKDYRSHSDSITIYKMLNHGVKQSFISGMCVFHQEHPRAEMDPWNHELAVSLSRQPPDEAWGLSDHILEERAQ
jgi:hypothetical protein